MGIEGSMFPRTRFLNPARNLFMVDRGGCVFVCDWRVDANIEVQ